VKSDKVLAYVGTYTGSGNNGEGIYLFEMNPQTGALSHRRLVARAASPSWIAIHPSKRYLYAINEVSDFRGKSGSVSAFAIDSASGDLGPLNTVSSEGAGPAYLSVDSSGKFAFVANYAGGSIAILPTLTDGSLGPAVDVHRDTGNLGSSQATSAAPGSFTAGGHEAPHAHMIAADPENRFVLATDLGQDRIYTYRFNPTSGKLTASANAPFVSLPSGDGPRHFVFHPNGHWFYSIQEQSSTIVFFHYDADAGSLTSQQTISTLPPGFEGTSFASEILMAPDGRFLYAANRLHDSVAVFAIDARGMLTHIGEASTLGDYPRHCCIDPRGNFLYVCNQRSDSITSFSIHRDSGLLTFTGQYTPVGSPAILTFLS
jgi:6-phosphogluconolactonase (cycloisomerase 2 family)